MPCANPEARHGSAGAGPSVGGLGAMSGASARLSGPPEKSMSDTGVLLALMAAATIRGAAPLVLAALGGLFSERAGVVDIGLEGKMLISAFAAAATAAVTGSAWIGLGAGIAASVLVALLHGFGCVAHQGNQAVSGMALNI